METRLMERRKRKCALTSTGLLMEGLARYFRVARLNDKMRRCGSTTCNAASFSIDNW